MVTEKLLNSQRQKKKARGIILPDFKLHHKATVIKTIWYWPKNRYNRCNGMKMQKKMHMYIYYKGVKNIQWGKASLFSIWCWKNWIFICQRMKLNPNLYHT